MFIAHCIVCQKDLPDDEPESPPCPPRSSPSTCSGTGRAAGHLQRSSAELIAQVHGERSRKRAAACAMLGFERYYDELDADVEAFDQGEDVLAAADNDPLSYRDVKDLIAGSFQKELKSAVFSRKALDLVEGAGTCDECPKRAGNDPEAVAAKVRADVCLDPDCYKAKEDAWNTKVIAKARESGKTVLARKEGDKLFTSWGDDRLAYGSGYVRLDDKCYADEKSRTYRQLLKGHVADDKVVVAIGPRSGAPVEIVKEDVAKKVLKEEHQIGASSPSNDKYAKEQRERRKKAEIGRAAGIVANGLVAEKVRDVLPPGFAVFQGGVPLLQQVAATVADFAGADSCRVVVKRRGLDKEKYGDRDAVENLALELTEPRELIALSAELAATRRTWNWGSPYASDNFTQDEKEFFNAFGIDRKKLVQEAGAEKKTKKAGGKNTKKRPAGKKDAASLTAAVESSIAQFAGNSSSEPGARPTDFSEPSALAPICADVPRCRICSCVESDCRVCIARNGSPCSWTSPKKDLCTACLPLLETDIGVLFVGPHAIPDQGLMSKLGLTMVRTIGHVLAMDGDNPPKGITRAEELKSAAENWVERELGRHKEPAGNGPRYVVAAHAAAFDMEELPGTVFDALEAEGVVTLPVLLERLAADTSTPAEFPLRNRLVAYFTTKIGAKFMWATHAADMIAKHMTGAPVAHSQEASAPPARFLVEKTDELTEDEDGAERNVTVWHVVDTTKTVLYERYVDEYPTEAEAVAAAARYEAAAKESAPEVADAVPPKPKRKGAKK